MASVPVPKERVLPTLQQDGSRRWIRPRLFKGRYYRRRLWVAWGLIVLFVALPLVKIGGKPAVLLDIPRREFHLFGRTFLPTDGVLLMLLLLVIFIAIVFLSALFGRVWCGWGCPQTVYMEYVFRPIERLIEGGHSSQKRLDASGFSLRRILKHGVFVAVSVLIGNVFLAYFVGVEQLGEWIQSSPFEQPTGFIVMAVTSGLVLLDFGYFREQMCTVVCPYARLQSVLLDRKSLVVAYDAGRGEPRGRAGKDRGDCIDCSACVVTCPTGIDIREGLQLECITCTQCIDACDQVMDKVKRPRGLIRYTSLDALEKGRLDRRGLIRPRTILYPLILLALVVALVWVGGRPVQAELTLLRGIGAPFVEEAERVRNHVRVKIRNRTGESKAFALSLEDAEGAELVAPENPMHLGAGEQSTSSVFVLAPRSFFIDGSRDVRFVVSAEGAIEITQSYRLIGPKGERP
jgi:cytochrome c oxidase accessory protein FixG